MTPRTWLEFPLACSALTIASGGGDSAQAPVEADTTPAGTSEAEPEEVTSCSTDTVDTLLGWREGS